MGTGKNNNVGSSVITKHTKAEGQALSYQLTECMLLLRVLKSTGDKTPFSELDF